LTRTQPNDAEIYAGRYKLILAASNSGFWWSRLTFVELRNPLLDDERRRRREREREREREVLEVDRRDRAEHVVVASVCGVLFPRFAPRLGPRSCFGNL